ncbi:MAG: DUF2291 domain-containing protein [Bacteroidales bacterium]|nr:DUF2291 domain-containing protein [Bacteroidales bacterium]
MQKKVIKYLILTVVVIIIVYNSVYFRKLSDLASTNQDSGFDAVAYAEAYWHIQIIPAISTSIELPDLLDLLIQNPDKAFQDHSHALGIGNIRYFMVKGEGIVSSVDENDVTVDILSGNTKTQVRLATEFIYGNAVRDAVGAIDLNEFTNTMDLNNVSAEINKKVRQDIIPAFKGEVKISDKIRFAGAIELNEKFLDLGSMEIIPVFIEFINE